MFGGFAWPVWSVILCFMAGFLLYNAQRVDRRQVSAIRQPIYHLQSRHEPTVPQPVSSSSVPELKPVVEFVVPRHMDEYFLNRTAEEYVKGIARCSSWHNFTGHNIINSGHGRFAGKFSQFTAAFNFSHHRAVIGFQHGDMIRDDSWPCLGFSGPRGLAQTLFFTPEDFVVISSLKGRTDVGLMTWEKRSPIPVWRGTIWWSSSTSADTSALSLEQLIQMEKDVFESDDANPGVSQYPKDLCYSRIIAVQYSLQHPHELDARVSAIPFRQNANVWKRNQSNGVHAFFPVSPIPSEKYYGGYQAAFVLGGIGAAFRLCETFRSKTAAILEDFRFELWFVRFLKPFVHYIPLAHGANNLSETLVWIQKNPMKVREIALRGRAFYDVNIGPAGIERSFNYMLGRVEEFLTS